jgi:hemolysin activation/secretion protein
LKFKNLTRLQIAVNIFSIMFRKSTSLILIFSVVFLNLPFLGLAAPPPPPPGQQMGGVERARELQEQSEKLQKQAGQPGPTKAAEKAPAETPEAPNAPKILVQKINVAGVTLFSAAQIKAITGKYENKELTLKEIQKVADLITDLYRNKGYITSRAFVPPQKIANGVLEIKVIEAKVGTIQVKGNHYFPKSFINRYVTLKQGDAFNYNDLKNNLVNVNTHPDLNVKAVLTPGETPGSTDIILNEKDYLPLHVTIGYDNFLSYYLDRNEYTYTFTDNNLSGHGDILTVQYNRAVETDLYYYYSGRYQYPVTPSLDLGFFYSRSNMLLGRDLLSIDSSGESKMYSLFGSQKLIKNDNVDFQLKFGFDYKDVDNYLDGTLSSRDYLRIPWAGLDFDMADDFGRTIISDTFDYGVPGIMGGTKGDLDANDMLTSREGASGSFSLDTLNLLRQQRLPYDMSLLWKNQLQLTNSKLTETEEFQAGGPANNRGFGPAAAVGDEGYAMSWELAVPPYFISKSSQIPYFKARTYDAFRFIGFYDWTNVHSNSIQQNENKNITLGSAGCGARLNILENFYARYEIAWPFQGNPTDGKSVHQWLQFTVTF